MRLLGAKTEKSHSLYLIIYQVFKSIFSIENETLRLFLQKKLFHVSESFCPFYYICTWKNKEVKIFISANFC